MLLIDKQLGITIAFKLGRAVGERMRILILMLASTLCNQASAEVNFNWDISREDGIKLLKGERDIALISWFNPEAMPKDLKLEN